LQQFSSSRIKNSNFIDVFVSGCEITPGRVKRNLSDVAGRPVVLYDLNDVIHGTPQNTSQRILDPALRVLHGKTWLIRPAVCYCGITACSLERCATDMRKALSEAESQSTHQILSVITCVSPAPAPAARESGYRTSGIQSSRRGRSRPKAKHTQA
jgi:hypothetical protein